MISRVISRVIGGVGIGVTNWFTPPLQPRHAVERSGGTHHRVDAGSVEFVVTLSQPRVTLVPAKAPVAWWV